MLKVWRMHSRRCATGALGLAGRRWSAAHL